jgi:hypothetical protein
LNDGTERKFINDNDTVIIKGFCKMDKWESVWSFFKIITPFFTKIIVVKL